MRIPLSKFINNLENFSNQPITILKDDIIIMVELILRQMAKYTIDDSGRSRSLIIKKFGDKYNIPYDDLDRDYHFWDAYYGIDSGRDFDGEGSTLSDSWGKKVYKANISAKDDALFQQAMGVLEPSDFHARETGRDNSQFKPRMIQFVADQVNRSAFNEVDGLEEQIDKLVQSVENYLFKGGVK